MSNDNEDEYNDMDYGRYYDPDVMVQRLECVTESANKVDSIRTPRAKAALLRAIDLMVGSMVPPKVQPKSDNVIPMTKRKT